MKSKGFTLIELLAVIVILAIIALIATPIILGIIDDARKSSGQESVNMYARAVQQAAARYQLKNPSSSLPSGIYKMSNNGKLLELESDSNIKLEVEFDGSEIECAKVEIKEDGKVVLLSCKVDGNGNYNYDEDSNGSSTCKLSEEEYEYTYYDYDLSTDITIRENVEVVTCGSEQFYVMERNDSTITMLTKYNLSTSVSPYKQSATNAGTIGWGYETSDEVPYWPSEGEYIYDTLDNPIKPIVNAYRDYLINTVGVDILSAGLMSSTQAQNIGLYFSSGSGSSCSEDKGWACSTHYWLGYVDIGCDDDWCAVANSDYWLNSNFVGGTAGIRPVITISADLIK